MGNVDQIGVTDVRAAARPPRAGASAPATRRSPLFWLLWLLILGMTVATVWCYQDQLRSLIPSTSLNQVLNRADQALAAGQLDGHDGNSARELYEAARALSPDNDRALQGLRQVATAELDACRQALAAGQVDAADQALAVARELNGGGVIIEQLQRDINARRGAGDKLEQWVQQAQAALAAGHLDGEGGAGPLYQQVLTLSPDNPVAAHGLDQVGAAMTAQARQAMAAHDLAAASDLISRLAALNPDYSELPVLRGELAGQQQASADQIKADLAQADQALHDGRIAGDQQDTALASYKAALSLDPQNAQAQAGLAQVAQALIMQANAALDAGDADQARGLVAQAAQLAPSSAELAAVQSRLQGVPAASATDTAAGAGPAAASSAASPAPSPQATGGTEATSVDTPARVSLTPAQQAQVSQWISQARQAAAAGQIMLPPGGSAYDLYRQALSTDPDNAEAQAGLQGLPARAQQALVVAMGSGQLAKAEGLLASLDQLLPGDASLGVLREQLANAWIDQAAQQLDNGDRVGTAQSLHHARQLSPRNLRLPRLYARLNALH
ncbi:hypothetical protein ACYJW8_05525 [Frateuria aurantia]